MDSASQHPTPASNPFRADRLRPGVLPYFFGRHTDMDCPGLLARWRSLGRRGQIVGPHGTGKSTLWTQFLGRLQAAGERVAAVTCRGDARCRWAPLPSTRPTVWAVDGYERLTWFDRLRLLNHCRRHELGVLITTHRPCWGLPTLWTTAADKETLAWVVEQLAGEQLAGEQLAGEQLAGEQLSGEQLSGEAGGKRGTTPLPDFDRLLDEHGNTREVLFALYDWYACASGPASRDAVTR